MDNRSLKSLIVDLHDSGISFQGVSNIIDRDYGIKKSRQAIAGLYNREKKRGKNNGASVVTSDIVNLYCILGVATDVVNEMKVLGTEVSYRYVLDTISKEKIYLESIKNKIVDMIVGMIKNCDTVDDIRRSIKYKGVGGSDKVFKEFIKSAFSIYIKDVVINEINWFSGELRDKALVNEIKRELRI